MSDPPRIQPLTPTKTYHPAARVIAPITGDIDQRLQQLADAISTKADHIWPTFVGVSLRSPNGTTWAVSIDDNGVVRTSALPRS